MYYYNNNSKMSPNYSLVVTSAMFMIPSVYGYYNNLYGISTLITGTSLVSINYWRNRSCNIHKYSLSLV